MSLSDPRIEEFIRLFNEREFFDAHEELESLWFETEGELKDFYKGLIQCAVAFVHLSRQNFRGAKKIYKTASAYLDRYPEDCEQINVAKLLKEFHAFFADVVPAAEESGSIDLDSLQPPVIELA
jgi:uncharacterized protein